MTEELRACVEGIHSTDPSAEVWVWDGHGCGAIDPERFPRGARLVNNGPVRIAAYLDSSTSALFFLGQHARAGTRAANLAHSFSSRHIASYRINGMEVGEFGCHAAVAGSYGIPTVFASGDGQTIAEARALIPGIYGAPVKRGFDPQIALHLAPDDARTLIRQVAAQATANVSLIAPFVIPGPPFELQIMIWGETDPERLRARGFDQTSARVFVRRANRVADLFT
jgi:D-amino peptidase